MDEKKSTGLEGEVFEVTELDDGDLDGVAGGALGTNSSCENSGGCGGTNDGCSNSGGCNGTDSGCSNSGGCGEVLM